MLCYEYLHGHYCFSCSFICWNINPCSSKRDDIFSFKFLFGFFICHFIYPECDLGVLLGFIFNFVLLQCLLFLVIWEGWTLLPFPCFFMTAQNGAHFV